MMLRVILEVEEADPRDIGRHIARLHRHVMNELGLGEGDCIEIRGLTKTGAALGPGLKDPKKQQAIRIDGRIRKNAGVTLNGRVMILRASVNPALMVTIAPDVESKLLDSTLMNSVKESLLRSFPIILHEGDLLVIRINGKPVPFSVVSTYPSGIVEFLDSTELIVRDAIKIV